MWSKACPPHFVSLREKLNSLRAWGIYWKKGWNSRSLSEIAQEMTESAASTVHTHHHDPLYSYWGKHPLIHPVRLTHPSFPVMSSPSPHLSGVVDEPLMQPLAVVEPGVHD